MTALATPMGPDWVHSDVDLEHVDVAAARRALRTQIDRLEGELGALEAPLPPPTPGAGGGARLQTIADLESTRDALLGEIRAHQAAAAVRGERQEHMRRLREEVLADPASYAFATISNEDIGEPGCLHLQVRPRFGILGMLMRWWRVRISSGCP